MAEIFVGFGAPIAMRICVDIQPAITQCAGIGRYTRRLVEHLAPLVGGDTLTLFYFDFRRRGLPFQVPGATERAWRWCPGRLIQRAWRTLRWPPFDRLAGAADLYHFPNFVIPPLRRGRRVVTVHDLSFLRFPQFAERRNLRHLRAAIRDTVGQADAVITDSEFSANEIVNLLSVPRDKVHAIHLGVDPVPELPPPEHMRRTLAALDIAAPYLLSVSTLEPRKNLEFLVEVFERLSNFHGQLVLAGMRGWKSSGLLARIRASPARDRIRVLGHVPDTLLHTLYAGAELFTVTSHYEGFGLPPLEAMAHGTPVVSSTGGALPEVLGAGAELVDSLDANHWVAVMDELLSDAPRRQELATRGRAWVARYSWQETARRTWAVYRQVCS